MDKFDTIKYNLAIMGIEDDRDKGDHYLDGVAFAIVENDWAGAEVLFLLQEKNGLTLDEAVMALESEEKPEDRFASGFQSLENVGLAQITDEGKYHLSEKGLDMATRLLKSLPTDSSHNQG